MRDAYHEELDSLTDRLVEMTHMVRSALSKATMALLDADLHLAENVIGHDDEVDEHYQSRYFELGSRRACLNQSCSSEV